MKIKNIRWGYAESGMTGNGLVEVLAYEDDGTSVFTLVSVLDSYEKVQVCSMSVFDIAMNMMSSDADFDAEMAKIEDVETESYDYECETPDGAIKKSEYAALINFARTAMKKFMNAVLNMDDEEKIREFKNEYMNKAVDDIDLPFAVNCHLGEEADREEIEF